VSLYRRLFNPVERYLYHPLRQNCIRSSPQAMYRITCGSLRFKHRSRHCFLLSRPVYRNQSRSTILVNQNKFYNSPALAASYAGIRHIYRRICLRLFEFLATNTECIQFETSSVAQVAMQGFGFDFEKLQPLPC
jgi:hypothetical protein